MRLGRGGHKQSPKSLGDCSPTFLNRALSPGEHAEERVPLDPLGLGKKDMSVYLGSVIGLLTKELANVGGINLVHVPEGVVVVFLRLELVRPAQLPQEIRKKGEKGGRGRRKEKRGGGKEGRKGEGRGEGEGEKKKERGEKKDGKRKKGKRKGKGSKRKRGGKKEEGEGEEEEKERKRDNEW